MLFVYVSKDYAAPCITVTRQMYVWTNLFESSLSEQMTFDPGQGLVRVVVSLLNQAQLFSLTLV